MNIIGEQVILKNILMTGVVMEKSANFANYFMVRIWDTDTKEYRIVTEHIDYMETVRNPLLVQKINEDDRESNNEMYDLLADMALDCGDKEWFEAICKDRNKPRKPLEASAQENNRIRVGRMVVDNNGQNSGIVLHECKHKPNHFMVNVWSHSEQKYKELMKPASSLKVVQVPSWNKTPNRSDQLTKDATHDAFMYMAAMTEDTAWLKELSRRELSEPDGA